MGGQGPTATCWLRRVLGRGKLSKECRSQSLFYLHSAVHLPSEFGLCSHSPTGTFSWEDKQHSGGTGKPTANRAAAPSHNLRGGQMGVAPGTALYSVYTNQESQSHLLPGRSKGYTQEKQIGWELGKLRKQILSRGQSLLGPAITAPREAQTQFNAGNQTTCLINTKAS